MARDAEAPRQLCFDIGELDAAVGEQDK